MPLVMNATQEDQSFKAFGKWFSFKPLQKKLMSEDMAMFISQQRRENGMVVLPADFEDPSFELTEEGKAVLEKKKSEGIKNYVDHHRDIIYNNQVSLRKDLERQGNKVDPAVEISDGELKAMEIVARYQKQKEDSTQKKVDHVKSLLKDIEKGK